MNNGKKNRKLHSSTDKIFNYSITTTCEPHTEQKFIVIQESVKTGKLQIQKNSCNAIQSIITKKRLHTRAIFVMNTKTKTRIIAFHSVSTKTRIMTICETITI